MAKRPRCSRRPLSAAWRVPAASTPANAMTIRPAHESDFDGIWEIFQAVIQPGDTYMFAADTPREDAHEYFLGAGVRSWVAEENDRLVGIYKLVPNRRDRGSLVANAKGSTNITYATTYASSGVTSLLYKLMLLIEAL